MSKLIHSSAYYFIALSEHELDKLISQIHSIATSLDLKGTVILSPEGINIAIAGIQEAVHSFKHHIAILLNIKDLAYRDTALGIQPFQKLFIKRKKQIIPFPNIDLPLTANTAPYLSPETLHQWLQEKRDIVMLDVRNQYEVAAGSFENKIELQLEHFRDFTAKTHPLKLIPQSRPLVTFCTGGIRCEKAARALLQQDFQNVYQLKGGILNYFARCGNDYYTGGCFVFDERNVVYPDVV